MAGPKGPATAARESASPGLCGSLQPPRPAAQTPLPDVVPVLRSSCVVRSFGGPDLHPDRHCFCSLRPPPFPSPHLMWTKIGGHPNREWTRPNTITQHLDAKRAKAVATAPRRTCGQGWAGGNRLGREKVSERRTCVLHAPPATSNQLFSRAISPLGNQILAQVVDD